MVHAALGYTSDEAHDQAASEGDSWMACPSEPVVPMNLAFTRILAMVTLVLARSVMA
jgi:hypothetical protein